MNEIKQKRQEIGNHLFELWQLLPEPKKSYTKWYQGIDEAIEDWCLSKKCIIFGATIDFKISIAESKLYDKCSDIWDHPEKYSKYKAGSEEAYYEFLKFLWVKYPDGKEQQLADITNSEK